MVLAVEEILVVGQDIYLNSISPTNSFGVTFADDLTTGYFYAIDTKTDLEVLDALHIYNDSDVVDKEKPGKFQIAWSDDGFIASLLINNYCHAIFDFENKAGYCRNGFPDNNSGWAQIPNRKLTDELISTIFSARK